MPRALVARERDEASDEADGAEEKKRGDNRRCEPHGPQVAQPVGEIQIKVGENVMA